MCALVFPFLPVAQDTAHITWPTGGDTTAVNAPLVGYRALATRAEVPCATVRSLDSRTDGSALLLATVPSARADSGVGLRLSVRDGELVASLRGEQVARRALPQQGCGVGFHSDAGNTTLTVGDTTVYRTDDDVRPRIIGVYSDIDGDRDPATGLAVSITPDTRYQSSPTTVKTGIAVLGALAAFVCLFSVRRADAVFGRRAPRRTTGGRWRPTGRDLTVVGVLGAWVFIGPVTSDDGYILTMARVAEDAGYLTNYHRWYGWRKRRSAGSTTSTN